MALGIGDNFSYKGKKPNFERDSFATKASMKAFSETDIDEGHIAFCKEDEKHYVFKSSNPVDSSVGKWRLLTAAGGTGGGGGVDLTIDGETLIVESSKIEGEILVI